jgi:hypothetical protein
MKLKYPKNALDQMIATNRKGLIVRDLERTLLFSHNSRIE